MRLKMKNLLKTKWGQDSLQKELGKNKSLIKSDERKVSLQEVNTPMEIAFVMSELTFIESENIDDIFIDNCAGDGNLTIPAYIFKLDLLLSKSDEISIKDLVLTLGSVYALEYDKHNLELLKTRIKNLVKDFLDFVNLNSEEIVNLAYAVINKNTIQSDSLSYTNPETNELYSILQYSDRPFEINGVSRMALSYPEDYLFVIKTQINSVGDYYVPHKEIFWDEKKLQHISEKIKNF
jgi:hypothetical protein